METTTDGEHESHCGAKGEGRRRKMKYFFNIFIYAKAQSHRVTKWLTEQEGGEQEVWQWQTKKNNKIKKYEKIQNKIY